MNLSTGAKPLSPPPLRDPSPDRLLAYLGNGLLGLRVGRVPLLGGLAIVNGFWGAHSKDEIPSLAPIPYPLAGDLAIDGVWASQVPEAVSFVDQSSDFATGELTSRFTFRAGVVRADVPLRPRAGAPGGTGSLRSRCRDRNQRRDRHDRRPRSVARRRCDPER